MTKIKGKHLKFYKISKSWNGSHMKYNEKEIYLNFIKI